MLDVLVSGHAYLAQFAGTLINCLGRLGVGPRLWFHDVNIGAK
jgi:hypothetical protein